MVAWHKEVMYLARMKKFFSEKDLNLLIFINGQAQKEIFDQFMRFITELGSWGFALFVPSILLITKKESCNVLGLRVAVALAISMSIVHSMKWFFKRPRPCESYNWILAQKVPWDKNSFPSGHSAAAMTMATVLAGAMPALWMSLLLFGLAVLVAISRVYLGVHYPSDVLFGASIGAVSAAVLMPMFLG